MQKSNKYHEDINHVNIFYMHDSFIENNSAPATHVSELINNFPENFNLHCIGPGPDRFVNNYIKIPRIGQKFGQPIFLKILWHFFNESIELGYLIMLILRYKPDLFLIRNGFFVSPFFLSKFFNIPIILELNGLVVAERSLLQQSKVLSNVVDIIQKILLQHPKKIIVVSPGIKQGLVSLYNLDQNKFIIISNGVNTKLFTILNSEISKNQVNLDNDFKYVCFVGSFAPWHGLEYLINAAPLILDKVRNVKFILIGDGATKNLIEGLIEKKKLSYNFILIDTIPHERIPLYVNSCDVCVILKRKDIPGSPLKLREYMACGKPVVATRSPDFDILTKYSAGILVDPEDIIEVSNAIIELLQDKDLSDNMGKNGRNCVVECYSWNKVASRVANVCYEIFRDNKQ